MESNIDTSKRRFLKYTSLLPWAVTAGIVSYQAKELGISTIEASENIQKATALNTNQYLQEQHTKLLQQYKEQGIDVHEDYGPWHTIQIMGLRKATEYAANEVFVSPDDAFKTMKTIETIFNIAYDSPADNSQDVYTDWMYNSLQSTGYHLGTTLLYQSAVTGVSNTSEEVTDEILDPLTRRTLMKMGAVISAVASLGFAKHAMDIQPLSNSIPYVQNDLYHGFPITVLNRISDIDTLHTLHNFISPTYLSTDVSIYKLDEESYDNGLEDLLNYYENRLQRSTTSIEDKEEIESRMHYLQQCTYDAYNIRLAYTNNALTYLSKKINSLPSSDRLLSIRVNDDITGDTILNSGIGLSVYHTTLMHQSVSHGTKVELIPSA